MTTHAFRLWIPLLTTLVCSACREHPSAINVVVGCDQDEWRRHQANISFNSGYRAYDDTTYVSNFESAIDLLVNANVPDVLLVMCDGIQTEVPAGTVCDHDCLDVDLYGIGGVIPVVDSLTIVALDPDFQLDAGLFLACADDCKVDIVNMNFDSLYVYRASRYWSGQLNLDMSNVSFTDATIGYAKQFRYNYIGGGALTLHRVAYLSPGRYGIHVNDLNIDAGWSEDLGAGPDFSFEDTTACNLAIGGYFDRLHFINYSFGTSEYPCAYGTASVSASAMNSASSIIVDRGPGLGSMQIDWGGDLEISGGGWGWTALQASGGMRYASISGDFDEGLSLSDITTLELQAEIELDNTELQTPAIQLSNIETAILSHSSVDISGGVEQTGIGLSNVGNVIADDLSVDVRSGVGLVAQNVGNLDISNSSISGSSHALEQTFGSSGAVSVLDSEIGGSIVLFSSDQELGQFGSDDIGEFWSCAWRDGDLNCI